MRFFAVEQLFSAQCRVEPPPVLEGHMPAFALSATLSSILCIIYSVRSVSAGLLVAARYD